MKNVSSTELSLLFPVHLAIKLTLISFLTDEGDEEDDVWLMHDDLDDEDSRGEEGLLFMMDSIFSC